MLTILLCSALIQLLKTEDSPCTTDTTKQTVLISEHAQVVALLRHQFRGVPEASHSVPRVMSPVKLSCGIEVFYHVSEIFEG